jgi:hypothetical protein
LHLDDYVRLNRVAACLCLRTAGLRSNTTSWATPLTRVGYRSRLSRVSHPRLLPPRSKMAALHLISFAGSSSRHAMELQHRRDLRPRRAVRETVHRPLPNTCPRRSGYTRHGTECKVVDGIARRLRVWRKWGSLRPARLRSLRPVCTQRRNRRWKTRCSAGLVPGRRSSESRGLTHRAIRYMWWSEPTAPSAHTGYSDRVSISVHPTRS